MNKLKRMNGRERTFLLITIPILALFFCFNTLPLIKGVIYSFTNFRGYGEFDWVGIRNYTDLFTDARVGKSYLFTFKLAIVATIVVNVLSLVLALGLNSKIKFKNRDFKFFLKYAAVLAFFPVAVIAQQSAGGFKLFEFILMKKILKKNVSNETAATISTCRGFGLPQLSAPSLR